MQNHVIPMENWCRRLISNNTLFYTQTIFYRQPNKHQKPPKKTIFQQTNKNKGNQTIFPGSSTNFLGNQTIFFIFSLGNKFVDDHAPKPALLDLAENSKVKTDAAMENQLAEPALQRPSYHRFLTKARRKKRRLVADLPP